MFTNRMKNILTEWLAIIISVMVAVPAFAGPSDTKTGRTVRMGYYSEAGLMNGAAENALKSGYAYEYIQELASHAGWKYEYVYGSFSELYQKLLNGEIDMLPYITWTEARSKEVLFPNKQMGDEQFFIASMSPNKLSDDLHEMQGAKVGTNKNAFHLQPFGKLMEEKGIKYELVVFTDPEERWQALAKGDVDYTIETSTVFQSVDLHAVYEFGERYPYYLIVAPERKDLLAELNLAHALLDEVNPGFLENLKLKYFKGIPLFKELPTESREWLSRHKVIRIGAYNNDAPYVVENKDGSITGILPDYIGLMMKAVGVDCPIEWKIYDGKQAATEALKADEIDCINPYYHNYSDAENAGLIISGTVYKSPFGVLYLGEYSSETLSVIATPDTRLGTSYVRDNYPDASVVPCLNGYDCIEKLRTGKATCVVMHTDALAVIAKVFKENFNMKSLNATCEICFAALPKDAPLISAINKSIPFVTDVELNAIQNRYNVAENTRPTESLLEFLKRHPDVVAVILCFVLATVILAYIQQQKQLKETLEMSEKLKESDRIISALSGDYVGVNYVELSENPKDDIGISYRTSELLKKLLPDAVKIPEFAAKMDLLRNRAVYEPDREQFYADTRRAKILQEFEKADTYTVYPRFFLDGEIKYYEMKYSAIREAGKVSAFVVGLRSIDEQRKKELETGKKLEEAFEKAQAADRAKTEFLFNMNHDIRTPMNAVTGFTAMAKKHIDDKETMKDYLDKIDTSGKQLLSLVDQVLEMARIESDQVEIVEKPVNIRERFDAMAIIFKEQAESLGISFSTALEDVRHFEVLADESKINSITLNIISNAMKYTPKGGHVDFKVKEINGRKHEFATYVLTVTDTGIGMSEEFQRHIFEPFARERSSTVSGIQGTGLGMSIVKRFVDRLGGNIAIHSEPGKGTRTDITLDLRINESAKAPVADVPLEVSFKGRKALLVEDNELNREIAVEILEDEGIEVDEAEDGAKAVEMVKAKGVEYYDFILMDIQMPVMNGLEATRAIREWEVKSKNGISGDFTNSQLSTLNSQQISRIPIVALSANAFAEDKAASLAAGMDDHVAKPVKIKELMAVLARVVRNFQ